jgi:hypothetical protein
VTGLPHEILPALGSSFDGAFRREFKRTFRVLFNASSSALS